MQGPPKCPYIPSVDRYEGRKLKPRTTPRSDNMQCNAKTTRTFCLLKAYTVWSRTSVGYLIAADAE